MREIKAPNKIENFSTNELVVFLAGSIEMGAAENWQNLVFHELMLTSRDEGIVLLNPRRDDWDSSWVQSIKNDKFREQVEWELWAMEYADVILMHFDPKTKSPITLLELGLFAKSGKLIVHCPEGFWRKGNVDIVCNTYGINTAYSLNELVEWVKVKLNAQR